jgi:hypothetical protein
MKYDTTTRLRSSWRLEALEKAFGNTLVARSHSGVWPFPRIDTNKDIPQPNCVGASPTKLTFRCLCKCYSSHIAASVRCGGDPCREAVCARCVVFSPSRIGQTTSDGDSCSVGLVDVRSAVGFLVLPLLQDHGSCA